MGDPIQQHVVVVAVVVVLVGFVAATVAAGAARADTALRCCCCWLWEPWRRLHCTAEEKRTLWLGLAMKRGRLWEGGVVEVTGCTHFRSLVAAVFALGNAVAGIVDGNAFARVAAELEAPAVRNGSGSCRGRKNGRKTE